MNISELPVPILSEMFAWKTGTIVHIFRKRGKYCLLDLKTSEMGIERPPEYRTWVLKYGMGIRYKGKNGWIVTHSNIGDGIAGKEVFIKAIAGTGQYDM